MMSDANSTQSGKSGLYYPNMFARIYFDALQHIVGEEELSAVLRLAGLDRYIGNLPPHRPEREFDFADFSALNAALEFKYGITDGHNLALQAGRGSLSDGLRYMGALSGVSDLAFKNLPLAAKFIMGIPGLARVFDNFSDQITEVIEYGNDRFEYIIKRCPVCWGRSSDVPVCHAAVGLIQEGLRWATQGQEFRVEETSCHAKGDQSCIITINKSPIT